MRKVKLVKYGQPDSKWTSCPKLGSVVKEILSNKALKQDKVSYRSQQLWLEAAGPLVACLRRHMLAPCYYIRNHPDVAIISDADGGCLTASVINNILHHLNPSAEEANK